MSYGWVLMVIAVGLILAWNILDIRPTYRERRVVGFSELKVEDFSFLQAGNNLTIYVRNEAPDAVEIAADSVTVRIDEVACNDGPPAPTSLEPTKGNTITIECQGPPSISDGYGVGDYIKADVRIPYVNTRSGNTHESVGVLIGYVE